MFTMLTQLFVLLAAVIAVQCQTTYSGCHNHSTVEFCYGPNGEETALVTYTLDSASTFSTITEPASTSASATTSVAAQTTAVTACHSHGDHIYCINGVGEEVLVSATATGEPPAQYTDCHSHGSDQYCVGPDGSDVLIVAEGASISSEEDHDDDSESTESSDSGEMDCHFHAGVEHCVAVGGSETSSGETELACGLTERDYNMGLRIGTMFVVLVTSGIGVFAPLLLTKLPFTSINTTALMVVKQFGTGVVIATAFVHLYTHASLMFNNECLGTLEYEATTSAIVMAGIIIAFLVEYAGHRVVARRSNRTDTVGNATGEEATRSSHPKGKSETDVSDRGANVHQPTSLPPYMGHVHGNPQDPTNPNSKVAVLVMEAGILFHSILIGLTLVVAGDSFYKTLLVVIVFHQFFEGLALGGRIALLPGKYTSFWPTKVLMAAAFTLITPIGMAIGLGVIHQFNGNEKSTIVAIGTLDSLSAGILVWVGVVDMLARDWVLSGGELLDANLRDTLLAGFGLVAGLVLMSVLGKWA